MTSKLELYNDTLLILGERKLASLSEAREPRRVLDDIYDKQLLYCLERGFWNFAMRAVQIDSSSSVTPTFGYTYAFTKPDDFVRLYQMSGNENFRPPLSDFVDEPNFWFADVDPLFGKYVSSDASYGRDLSIWPESFSDFVAHRFAVRGCKRITGADPDEQLRSDYKRALAVAGASDAMNEPPGQMPEGSWVSSRGGNPRRGPITRLIG